MKKDKGGKPVLRVVVRRANGRFVREFPVTSKYAAKKRKQSLESRYDDTYRVDIEPGS